jgi:hypothetical protein
VITLITQNVVALGVIGAAISFSWSVIQFILVRQKEFREKKFEAYHRLVKELVSPDPETKVLWLDRQAAVVFELRHFPRYFEYTFRLLNQLKSRILSSSGHI